jgi:hypothetical protein
MAISQFSLFLIPKKSIQEMFPKTPLTLPMDVAEDSQWWSGQQPPKGFEEAIGQILPESPSWSESMRIWGTETGNSILVLYVTDEKREVEEIEIRIDAALFSAEFVSKACKWATDFDCIARTKMYEVITPSFAVVTEAIMSSRAMKFLNDPVKVLQSLKKEEFG